MRRVLAMHSPEYLNRWLEKYKDAVLVDVKPAGSSASAILAIVEFPDDTKRVFPMLHINTAKENQEENTEIENTEKEGQTHV